MLRLAGRRGLLTQHVVANAKADVTGAEFADHYLPGETRMARISTVEGRNGYVVAIRGDITSADLRRLEHACGPAIERQRPLEIVFGRTTSMDAAARAYLQRLESRGALVIRR